jgi:hypothetical protein
MTYEEKELVDRLSVWVARLEQSASQFDQTNTLGVQLPLAAARQLRNLSEAVVECECVIQTFAGRVDASKEALSEVAGCLRTIHRRLDDVVLPAATTD